MTHALFLGSHLVDLTVALQAAAVARADVSSVTGKLLTSAAGAAVVRCKEHAPLGTDGLDGEASAALSPAEAEAVSAALASLAALQHDLFASGDAWRASTSEVRPMLLPTLHCCRLDPLTAPHSVLPHIHSARGNPAAVSMHLSAGHLSLGARALRPPCPRKNLGMACLEKRGSSDWHGAA